MRRKLYKELGGYVGYRKTPVRIVQECILSIAAENEHNAEEQARIKKEQEEAEREAKRNARR